MSEISKSRIKYRIGTVIRKPLPKTIIVEYDVTKTHLKYGKRIRLKKRFMVHDEKDQAQIGQNVRAREIRPISKRKRWALAEILAKN